MMKIKIAEKEKEISSFRKQANIALPLQDEAYTYEGLMKEFKLYLKPSNIAFYESSLKLIFNLRPEQKDSEDLRFPKPIHPVKTIISGWQCLLSKLIEAENQQDAEEINKNALLDVLALHKKTLEKLDPTLFKIVNEHAPCQNCVASSKVRALDQ
ncbi:hypothetical protein [Candidatus Bealeia paramacronuclearis]